MITDDLTFVPYEHPAPKPLEAWWQERDVASSRMDPTAPFGSLPHTLYRLELSHLDDLRERAGVYR